MTLDTPVGGVNPMAVRYMADVEGGWGRIVWMPTHDSEHEVDYNKETRAKAIVSRNGKLIPEVFEVLDLIKERNLTLATGHVEPEEALMIMAEAKKRGITRIIVTHPLLGPQFTYMSLPQLQESVKLGGAIEITAGTLSRDGAGKTRAIEVIKALGTQNVFVASDSGLVGHSQSSGCLGHGREIAACRRVQRTGSEPDVQGDARPSGGSAHSVGPAARRAGFVIRRAVKQVLTDSGVRQAAKKRSRTGTEKFELRRSRKSLRVWHFKVMSSHFSVQVAGFFSQPASVCSVRES